MKIAVVFLLGLFITIKTFAQSGCTDPQANNYNPAATTNDGSCTYAFTAYTLTNPKALPASLNESSGLIYTDGQLWTMNDSGGAAAIYKISETDGHVVQTVTISNASNSDWEAITSDATYIYIGDFGNNVNGSRTDLKIYRVSKATLGTGTTTTVTADIINFSYQDQGNPVPTAANKTKFDCEAFLVKDNQLHLFTKDWLTYKTVHYTLPATPGSYIAERKEEFAVNGLITDAHISTTNADEIVLIGYSENLLNLFMWVLWDYAGNNFFGGNKRQISLGISIDKGQIEGVTYTSNGNGYISSERIDRSGFVVPARLYSFSTVAWVPLPVRLVKFSGAYNHSGVTLSWQTASEIDNEYFTVERAVDALHFRPIGRHNGAGNTKVRQNYTYTDVNPEAGINYYRLKQTDLDGTFSYSSIISVHANQQLPIWQVSPVPVSQGQFLHIKFTHNPAGATVYIISIDGKIQLEKVITGNPDKEESLPTQDLQPGVYFLKFRGNNMDQVAKVVVK